MGREAGPPTGPAHRSPGPALSCRPFISWEQGAIHDLWVSARPRSAVGMLGRAWGWGVRPRGSSAPPPHRGSFQPPALAPPGKGPEGAVSCQAFLPQPPAAPLQARLRPLLVSSPPPAPSPAQPSPGHSDAREDRSPGTAPTAGRPPGHWSRGHSSLRPRPRGVSASGRDAGSTFLQGLAPHEDASQRPAASFFRLCSLEEPSRRRRTAAR